MITDQISSGGTSIWLDDLSRSKITGLDPHSLPHRIARDGVVGVTTNPSIFCAAISKGSEYAGDISKLRGSSPDVVIQKLTTDDVRNACDLFVQIHEKTHGVDGRVSIEVDPRSARNTQATITEGIALWKIVDRPNVLIKVPATVEGLPAITQLIAEGISVNVTLIFSVARYLQVMDAFMKGLEFRVASGFPISDIASVASFFISRIDSAVDAQLKKLNTSKAQELLGKTAIANAALAYQAFLKVQETPRWKNLSASGARMQRPLWASTGVKDPSYLDTRYVLELIDAHCVNTMPQSTLDAVLDHGVFLNTPLSATFTHAEQTISALDGLGISLDAITDFLETDGVAKFADSWLELIASVEKALNA
ncbi:unannotated protein [freshwater metagenome]|uniref:Unannotated protein n=1 Tax=freshwater metagenome TaxID=449393 RepID=A0A6J6NME4_9ZZZZ|nr:transaldolase [Actinomycetota bacterium]MSV63262.1 transaldolase [Actinomycetota bacterium]MSW26076.1 transaldolase [Actinomycetota bacterium]MSW33789.1 transaldolase [Actinomycetota bacterium]MSX31521.1 transaldolase [Actinomycetota bacterium]